MVEKNLVNAQGFRTQDEKYRSARSVLVVVGGLPATGKSTIAGILARQTKTPYLRIDRIERRSLPGPRYPTHLDRWVMPLPTNSPGSNCNWTWT